jgi:hypothetical protein
MRSSALPHSKVNNLAEQHKIGLHLTNTRVGLAVFDQLIKPRMQGLILEPMQMSSNINLQDPFRF